MDIKLQTLTHYFSHHTFRDGQEELISAILAGKDSICVMPSGGGKSLCYQISSMILNGLTVVVEPLTSIMQQQVAMLTARGIPAAYVNESLNTAQIARVYQNLVNRSYKIIYLPPERLMEKDFLRCCNALSVSLLAIEEAQCLSRHSPDFHVNYRMILDFLQALQRRPAIAAFSSSASNAIRLDVARILRLYHPLTIVTGVDVPFAPPEAPKVSSPELETQDITEDARRILTAYRRLRHHLGRGLSPEALRHVLLGSIDPALLRDGLEQLPDFGSMKGSQDKLQQTMAAMEQLDLFALDPADGTIVLTTKTRRLLFEGQPAITVIHTNDLPAPVEETPKPSPTMDEALLAELKTVRKLLAADFGKTPPQIVTNATLADMAAKKPQNVKQLQQIEGIGPIKAQRYGPAFLAAIHNYTSR